MDTSAFFVHVDVSTAKGDGSWRRSPFTGNWPNARALPQCRARSSLGIALNVLPNAELLAVDARHQPPAPSNCTGSEY
jgi:hypothetical protein